jgi:hypothetical protein
MMRWPDAVRPTRQEYEFRAAGRFIINTQFSECDLDHIVSGRLVVK